MRSKKKKRSRFRWWRTENISFTESSQGQRNGWKNEKEVEWILGQKTHTKKVMMILWAEKYENKATLKTNGFWRKWRSCSCACPWGPDRCSHSRYLHWLNIEQQITSLWCFCGTWEAIITALSAFPVRHPPVWRDTHTLTHTHMLNVHTWWY